MNTVILNGSPRKGNTQTAIQALKEQATGKLEVIHLKDKNIAPCDACDGCKATGSCVHSEDTNEIIEKVAAADCIIFATPVYWWGVSAQLKLALDKFYSRSEALKKKTKKIGIIAIGEDTLDGPQYDLISKQFRCICEYLNWELVLDQAICAGGPEDLSKDKAQLEKLSHWGQQL